jgi:hypothetical protein
LFFSLAPISFDRVEDTILAIFILDPQNIKVEANDDFGGNNAMISREKQLNEIWI